MITFFFQTYRSCSRIDIYKYKYVPFLFPHFLKEIDQAVDDFPQYEDKASPQSPLQVPQHPPTDEAVHQ